MDCPECHVSAGEWHRPGCEGEQCPYCGDHAVDCDCAAKPIPLDDRIRWSGSRPWEEACGHFGFFERQVRGGWIPCDPDEPGSMPDIVRLMTECSWDRLEKRFVNRRRAAA
jgi:hypothetical protein